MVVEAAAIPNPPSRQRLSMAMASAPRVGKLTQTPTKVLPLQTPPSASSTQDYAAGHANVYRCLGPNLCYASTMFNCVPSSPVDDLDVPSFGEYLLGL